MPEPLTRAGHGSWWEVGTRSPPSVCRPGRSERVLPLPGWSRCREDKRTVRVGRGVSRDEHGGQ